MAARNEKLNTENTQILLFDLKALTNPGDPWSASFSIAACGTEKSEQIGSLWQVQFKGMS